MKNVIISVDSAADIPADIAEKYDIKIAPMCVMFGNEVKKDGENITAPELFDYAERTGVIPRTSALSPGEYEDYFKGISPSGEEIIHLSFCSLLSSTCRNASMAASMLGNVRVIDTLSLAGGMALLAIKGCEMRDNGKDAQTVFSELSSLIHSTRVSYLLEDIGFLARSGRCSSAAAFGANLLSIKPCAAVLNGRIEIVKKYRSKAKAARWQYANEQLGKYKNIDFSAAFIYHSGVDALEISEIEALLKKSGFEQVITAFTGCMISLHSGRGALGIHFIAH